MERLRQILTWAVRGLLFLIVLVFAMKNTDPVSLKFLFGTLWEAPLALMLFITLVIGAAFGLLAGLERLFEQRREILALERRVAQLEGASQQVPRAPPAASGADFDPRATID